ncbi:hypothetical protein TEQG_06369 [Trichophyton equinum CBS 127.97]|uniref:Uncharacterized protein n=1 Tax=Trichophyton equinum (strain ATCC MYA-4606 / CBS 127.97) TaxID=559882 RepID=F2PZR7_TRIEC|nr:hypothetical protein TEQG_06369 [Trichophyton equinum CBS 127.97]
MTVPTNARGLSRNVGPIRVEPWPNGREENGGKQEFMSHQRKRKKLKKEERGEREKEKTEVDTDTQREGRKHAPANRTREPKVIDCPLDFKRGWSTDFFKSFSQRRRLKRAVDNYDVR